MWNLRNMELGSVEEAPAPRTGKVRYLDHPQLKLIGSVAYWARGGMTHAVTMIVTLTVKLGITERVRNAIPQRQHATPRPTQRLLTSSKLDLQRQSTAKRTAAYSVSDWAELCDASAGGAGRFQQLEQTHL